MNKILLTTYLGSHTRHTNVLIQFTHIHYRWKSMCTLLVLRLEHSVTMSTMRLVMPWFLMSPGHHHQGFWLYTKRLLSSSKNDFHHPFLVWRNGRKCKHIFYPENNLAFKWLIFTVGQMTSFIDNHRLVLSSSGRTNPWVLIMLLIGVIS